MVKLRNYIMKKENIKIGVKIKANWDGRTHKIVNIIDDIVFYSDLPNGEGKIYQDDKKTIIEHFKLI